MQIQNSIRSPLVVAGVVAALLLAGRAQAQVMDQVPSDALAVLRIKDLDAVSKKAGKMAKELGLDQMSPELGDPLGLWKTRRTWERAWTRPAIWRWSWKTPTSTAKATKQS